MGAFTVPVHIPFHRTVLHTKKGAWLCRVASLLAGDQDAIGFQLCLEHADSENKRRLFLMVSAADLESPQEQAIIAQRICVWIEDGEGNGALDLVPAWRRKRLQKIA